MVYVNVKIWGSLQPWINYSSFLFITLDKCCLHSQVPILNADTGDVFLPIIFCFPLCPTWGFWSLVSKLFMGNHQLSVLFTLPPAAGSYTEVSTFVLFSCDVFLIFLYKTIFWCTAFTSLANCCLCQSSLHPEIILLQHPSFVFICLILFRWYAPVKYRLFICQHCDYFLT